MGRGRAGVGVRGWVVMSGELGRGMRIGIGIGRLVG